MAGGKKRYWILAWGTITFLLLGLLYSWSRFAPSIREEFGYSQARITLAYTLSMVTFAVGITADGVLAKHIPPRASAALGTILAGVGYLFTSLVPAEWGSLIYLTYGVLVGFGIGLCYNVWLNTVMNWFPEKRGFASGVVLLGMGFSGFTIVPLAAGWLTQMGWRPTFRLLALLVLIEGLVALCFLCQAPASPRRVVQKTISAVELTTGQVVRQPSFWTYTLWKLVLLGTGLAFAGQVATMVADVGAPGSTQTIAVSLFGLCNGCARPVAGVLSDRLGVPKTLTVLAGVELAAALLLSTAYPAGNLGLVLLGLGISGVCYGGATAMGPNFMSGAYGAKHYRQNMGINALTGFPVSLITSSAISLVKTSTGSYTLFLWILVPLTVAALCMGPVTGRSLTAMRKKYIVEQE